MVKISKAYFESGAKRSCLFLDLQIWTFIVLRLISSYRRWQTSPMRSPAEYMIATIALECVISKTTKWDHLTISIKIFVHNGTSKVIDLNKNRKAIIRGGGRIKNSDIWLLNTRMNDNIYMAVFLFIWLFVLWWFNNTI